MIVEPKLNELFSFFYTVEHELNQLNALTEYDLIPFEDKREAYNQMIAAIYEFNRSFLNLITPIDQNLSAEFQGQLNHFQDHLTKKLFIENLDQEGCENLKSEFHNIKNQVIHQLYHWNK